MKVGQPLQVPKIDYNDIFNQLIILASMYTLVLGARWWFYLTVLGL